jgi:hypothetical protein
MFFEQPLLFSSFSRLREVMRVIPLTIVCGKISFSLPVSRSKLPELKSSGLGFCHAVLCELRREWTVAGYWELFLSRWGQSRFTP